MVLGDAGYGAKGGQDTLLLDEKLGLLLKLQDDEGQKPAMFSLAEALEKALAEAEEKRLLYVAVTRAEQMVLVSGVIGINTEGKPTASGWLKTIGQVAGWQDLTWPVINPSGTTVHEMSLQVGTSPVRLVVGEGQRITGDDATYDEPVAVVAPFVVPELLAPLRFAAAVTDEHPKEAEQPQRVWQVVPTAQKPTAPAWVVGSLVHTALALWRFPGADFAQWCEARAREYGLTDHAQLRDAERKTRQLLDRFHQHPLYAQMNQAERRLAELPYVVTRNGQVERGIIDALYLYEGQWTIVDYKTDEVADEAELFALLATKDYRQQLSRYALAVEQLVGLRPRLLLCFLQVGTQIHLVPV
ncbi:MAG: PD-(D/E)XK nuclease family protein [Chloroflexi bacterium]|nr:PD-(D/E)XK nuclease family protein [Chloroflexota bacterium]